jgi:hypothetical protein
VGYSEYPNGFVLIFFPRDFAAKRLARGLDRLFAKV